MARGAPPTRAGGGARRRTRRPAGPGPDPGPAGGAPSRGDLRGAGRRGRPCQGRDRPTRRPFDAGNGQMGPPRPALRGRGRPGRLHARGGGSGRAPPDGPLWAMVSADPTPPRRVDAAGAGVRPGPADRERDPGHEFRPAPGVDIRAPVLPSAGDGAGGALRAGEPTRRDGRAGPPLRQGGPPLGGCREVRDPAAEDPRQGPTLLRAPPLLRGRGRWPPAGATRRCSRKK